MPTRRSADAAPDLFSATPPAKAPEPPAEHAPADSTEHLTAPRYLLPRDLAGALTRLDDGEIDALLSAVGAEASRRGRAPGRQNPPRPDPEAKSQLNAVRAAFKAGVKPSAIARQFGISQSDVRKALAVVTRQ
jgi:DNA invertase Pin-like site-specific DNA recombinase